MIARKRVDTADHHSEYLARAVSGLTAQGRQRVHVLLTELAASFADHPAVARFAEARATESDLGRVDASTDPASDGLTDAELEELRAGFTVIRDQEPLGDVADWANAVLALLGDEVHRRRT